MPTPDTDLMDQYAAATGTDGEPEPEPMTPRQIAGKNLLALGVMLAVLAVGYVAINGFHLPSSHGRGLISRPAPGVP